MNHHNNPPATSSRVQRGIFVSRHSAILQEIPRSARDDGRIVTNHPTYRLKYWSIGAIFFSLITTSVFAAPEAEDKNPLGCRDVGYQFKLSTVELQPHKEGEFQSLYFMFNKTNKPISLYQMRDPKSGEKMSINHEIPPQRWAALSINENAVRYACTVSQGKNNYGQLVDCEQSIKVCEFVRVKYGLNNRGNFWMVSGNSKNGALREVTNYGVIAR